MKTPTSIDEAFKESLCIDGCLLLYQEALLNTPDTSDEDRWKIFRWVFLKHLFIGFEKFEKKRLENETLRSVRLSIAKAKKSGKKSIQITKIDLKQHLEIENPEKFKTLKFTQANQGDLYKTFKFWSDSKTYHFANEYFGINVNHSILRDRYVGVWHAVIAKLLREKKKGKDYCFTITREQVPLKPGQHWHPSGFGCGWNAIITVSWK